MAELNLKQIIDRLNAEFVGDTRKLVFWYDDKADFAEDMENVELENAKIYISSQITSSIPNTFWNGWTPPPITLSTPRSPSPMCGKTTWRTPCCTHDGSLPTVPHCCR